MITQERINQIRVRLQLATPGPWKSFIEGRDHFGGSSIVRTSGEDLEILGATGEDIDFIAHARQDVPELLAEVERLRALLASPSTSSRASDNG